MTNLNKMLQIDEMPYAILSTLINENENIWKILKYSSADALYQSNLTQTEKGALIYNGEEISTPFRVFRSSFTEDALDDEISRLHVYISNITPDSNTHSKTDFMFEIFSHNKIVALNDYKNRNEHMLAQIIDTLNGKYINGIGNLFFNYKRSYTNMANIQYFNKFYQGYRLVMSNHNV